MTGAPQAVTPSQLVIRGTAPGFWARFRRRLFEVTALDLVGFHHHPE